MKLALLLLALVSVGGQRCVGGDCGLVGVKPIIPIGCRDLVAECVCNSAGTKCGYLWRCIK